MLRNYMLIANILEFSLKMLQECLSNERPEWGRDDGSRNGAPNDTYERVPA